MSCKFTGPSLPQCNEATEGENYCYWHQDEKIKTEPDLKQRLIQRARNGKPMVYFKLRNSDLSEIDLVNHGHHQGFQLLHADLYRANLSNAHLFGLDLSHSSLMKADLRGANLHGANLEQANLLGTKLDNAKLETTHWGDKVRQEYEAERTEEQEKKQQLYSEAEEIYRNIGRVMRNQGLVSLVGRFFYREMVCRRKQMPRLSPGRALSKLTDLYCGYGEKPFRLILISILMIFVFACLFSISGLEHHGSIQQLSWSEGLSDNLSIFFNSLYFSVVTFTTLGYGDISPVSLSRLLASIEAFIGSFTLALFVVVFVRRTSR